jgi:hypothetical protein
MFSIRRDRGHSAADWQLHRGGDSFTRGERGTAWRNRRQLRARKLPIWANGQRDTSNSFGLLNGVDASNLFQWQVHQPGALARVINSTGVSTSSGGGGLSSHPRRRFTSRSAMPSPRPRPKRSKKSASTPPCMTPRRVQPPARTSTSPQLPVPTFIHGTCLRTPRHQLDQRRSVLLQERSGSSTQGTIRIRNCIGTSSAALSAVRLSRTSSSASSPINTCTSPTRRSATRFLNVPVGLSDTLLTVLPPASRAS